MKKASLLLVMVALLSSCVGDPKQVAVDLTNQLPPDRVNLTEDQLKERLEKCMCVSDDTYIDIIETYRRKNTLRGIIESTRE